MLITLWSQHKDILFKIMIKLIKRLLYVVINDIEMRQDILICGQSIIEQTELLRIVILMVSMKIKTFLNIKFHI